MVLTLNCFLLNSLAVVLSFIFVNPAILVLAHIFEFENLRACFENQVRFSCTHYILLKLYCIGMKFYNKSKLEIA